MVVTEIRTPTNAPLRASVSDNRSRHPSQYGNDHGEQVGVTDEVRERTLAQPVGHRDAVGPTQHYCQAGGCDDGDREPDRQGDEAASHSAQPTAIETHRDRCERAVLRPHDHGPDYQNR